MNVARYPQCPNSYDSLGEAYEMAGKWDLAEKNYLIAIEKAEETKDVNKNIFESHLYRIKIRKNTK